MTQALSFRVADGFAPEHRATAARLFWEAFGGKLRRPLGPEARAIAFIERVLDPAHAIGATTPAGALIGVAGFKTRQGALVGGALKDFQAIYGWAGGLARGLLMSVLERPAQPGVLTMDGVMVSAEARGMGVGAALLSAVKAKASQLECAQVRLDVIDANPRARALYEREGFVAQGRVDLGPLRHVFGFRRATTMVFTV